MSNEKLSHLDVHPKAFYCQIIPADTQNRLLDFGTNHPPYTAAIIFLYIYIYPFVRRALNLLRASFSPIFHFNIS